MNIATMAAVWAVAAQGAAPATPSSVHGGAMTESDAAVAIMDYYPAAARAAKVEGYAFLRCAVSEHARLSDCALLREKLPGSGFGEAALTLSKLSKDNPEVTMTPKPAGEIIEFTFSLDPPSISPNTLAPAHVITPPTFVRRPNLSEMVWPPAVIYLHRGGRVELDCIVTAEGRLQPCAVVKEAPTGQYFGKAAVEFAAKFRMKPGTRDGVAEVGGHFHFPIVFVPR